MINGLFKHNKSGLARNTIRYPTGYVIKADNLNKLLSFLITYHLISFRARPEKSLFLEKARKQLFSARFFDMVTKKLETK
ncbi:hypothetical protein BpHYR1_004664 [Brachionus plicatilis]|uniref:Uncharacterized protein n=1 Tax=Brachionus plicatilis TaxID=10195 RepID=A0A3M7SJ60_BRAPC|nr:hypothetical protein BpHYR1_004664 [Brachionus plicatilis]